jgi:Carboxypeptidase regulatory-like domain/TonB-dependent Receptor Plug Domain
MKTKILFSTVLLLATIMSVAQNITQNIRGTVIDKDSKSPIASVTVMINENQKTTSDANGNFIFTALPVGRYNLQTSKMGYLPQTIADLQLNVAKEIVLTIELEESVTKLNNITVRAKNDRTKTVNEMVTVSGRTFSVNEANRFAGSQNDPSRMARNYAGVSGASDQRNDIIIRGNAPQGLLWRIEGVPVPNPNHFAGQGSTGGPISIINYKMLSNSDFLTGAFPAEYGNATSGVFDVKIRNGNNKRAERTIQIGALGLEALLEGPLGKNGSSYLIGYRYSTLSILANAGVKLGFASVPYYQDGSAKFNFITKKAGTFKVFFIAGKSNTAFYDNKRDSTQFSPANAGENVYFGSRTSILGLSHTYFFNTSTYIKTTVASTHEGNANRRDSIQANGFEKPTGGFGYNSNRLVLNSYINKKINPKNIVQGGIVVEHIDYATKDSLLFYKPIVFTPFWGTNNDFAGSTQLLQAYAQWKYKPTDNFTINGGLHSQLLTLNNNAALEPRLAFRYQIKQNQAISFGYGMHQQTQPYAMYFYRNINAADPTIETNKDLKFSTSNQFVLGYDYSVNTDFRIKLETYYQYLNNVPVDAMASSYSVLNYGTGFYNTYRDNLVNEGKGQNYGVELTAEKFFSKHYYFLVTTSVFNSTYQGSDLVWRNTAFNGNYVGNALLGYEIKAKNNFSFLIDAKVTVAGGLRFTALDTAASIANKEAKYQENKAFEQQNKTYFKPDLKFTIRKDFKRKIALEWALDIQNVVNYQNVFLNWYDKNTQTEHPVYQNGRFPTVQLKLEF